jgi:hypothetical protein
MPRTQTYRTAAVGYAGALACLAGAEAVVGDLDRLDDVGAISAGAGRLVVNGLVHLAGGVLLVLAVVGLVELVRGSVMGRIGWWVLAVSAPCGGAFAMLHLLAVETAAPGLDGAAMEQFLVERLGQGAGAWAVPIAVYALLAPLGHVLLTTALARRRVISWAAPTLVLLGAVGHAVLGTGTTEIASLMVMAAGGLVAGWNLWSGTAAPRTEPVHADPAVV